MDNIRTYEEIVKNYGDVYRLTDTPFTCKGLQVEVKLRENVTAGPKIVCQPVKVSRFMLWAQNCPSTCKRLQVEKNKITTGPKIVRQPVKVTRLRTKISK